MEARPSDPARPAGLGPGPGLPDGARGPGDAPSPGPAPLAPRPRPARPGPRLRLSPPRLGPPPPAPRPRPARAMEPGRGGTETVGKFEFSRKDLIGHGAFAVVFKGRHREVRPPPGPGSPPRDSLLSRDPPRHAARESRPTFQADPHPRIPTPRPLARFSSTDSRPEIPCRAFQADSHLRIHYCLACQPRSPLRDPQHDFPVQTLTPGHPASCSTAWLSRLDPYPRTPSPILNLAPHSAFQSQDTQPGSSQGPTCAVWGLGEACEGQPWP